MFPTGDAFRNHLADGHRRTAEDSLVEKAEMLTLSAPERAVLVGGMRVLNANVGRSKAGVLTRRRGALINDFFVNLLDINTAWKAVDEAKTMFEFQDGKTGEVTWTRSRDDLIFDSNSQLRAIAEVYACSDSQQKFVRDFVAA